MVQEGWNLAQPPSHPQCARRTRASWNRTHILGVVVLPSWPPWQIFNMLSRCGECIPCATNQQLEICRKRMVIKSVLWLVSNGALVAKIWRFQVWGVGYVHVCGTMCTYHDVWAGMRRYMQVSHVCVGIMWGMCRYCRYVQIWNTCRFQWECVGIPGIVYMCRYV
jgi:hypothetical protein